MVEVYTTFKSLIQGFNFSSSKKINLALIKLKEKQLLARKDEQCSRKSTLQDISLILNKVVAAGVSILREKCG